MGTSRSPLRLALFVPLVAVLCAVAATTAYALAIDDGAPCPVGAGNVYTCPTGTVEAQYSVQIVSRGGCGPALPYQYRVLNGALPPGISLSSSGLLSGKPTTAGKYRFWVELSDQNPPTQSWCRPETAEREFSIDVNPRVLITTETTTPGTLGSPYSQALTAVMKSSSETTAPPSSPVTWSVVEGTLPAGLALNPATGVVAGTPTSEGEFSFLSKAALLDGRSDTKWIKITVRKPLTITAAKPLAATPAPTLWEVGAPFSAKLTASGGSGTYTYTLSGGTLPTGLALAADGTVSGTPSAAGAFRATIRVADSEGRGLDYAANFGVAQKLTISTILLKPGKVGRVYSAKVATSGGVKPVLMKLKGSKPPAGVKFDSKLGKLVGIPTTAGVYRLSFVATDSLGVTATKTLRLVVAP